MFSGWHEKPERDLKRKQPMIIDVLRLTEGHRDGHGEANRQCTNPRARRSGLRVYNFWPRVLGPEVKKNMFLNLRPGRPGAQKNTRALAPRKSSISTSRRRRGDQFLRRERGEVKQIREITLCSLFSLGSHLLEFCRGIKPCTSYSRTNDYVK